MCGLAGLFNFTPSFDDILSVKQTIKKMTDSIVHRGPDSEGIWVDDQHRCVLGHRRLSIIDISDAGHQPMTSANRRWTIAFNGEIYNYKELRKELLAKGTVLKSNTDTEVLLEMIALWGVAALPKFDGMFAFAAFDALTGELLLGRDPFGEKPLYYMPLQKGGWAFASELQALEGIPGFDSEVSIDSLSELLMFQYIGAPRTIFQSVSKLSPGHWMRLTPNCEPEIGRYFTFAPGRNDFDPRSKADLVDELEDILCRSISRRLISDVPLGAFLSGGVDSSTVCALITKKLGLNLRTYSIGFHDAPESEHEIARLFSKHLGTEHHDQILTPDIGQFLSDIGNILDEPNCDSSCMPTYLLSNFARQHVTVAISGDGGDEMFAGYGRYFSTLEESLSSPPSWSPGKAYYSGRILVMEEPIIRNLLGYFPSGLQRHLLDLRARLNQDDIPLFCRLRQTDVDNYMPGAVLPKVDRMSMQHSLEVRTPFLNVELARFAERLSLDTLYSKGSGKLLLKEVAYRYLPHNLIDMPKKGFGLPMDQWGREQLLATAGKLLESDDSRLAKAIGRESLTRFLTHQRSEGGFSTYQVWSLGVLESWLRNHNAALNNVADAINENVRSTIRHTNVPCLVAWEIGANEYLLTEGEDKPSNICTQSNVGKSSKDKPRRHLVLPFWGGGVIPQKAESFSKYLAGSCLYFSKDIDTTLITRREVEKYASLGVKQIVYQHPFLVTGTLVNLKILPNTNSIVLNYIKLWWFAKKRLSFFSRIRLFLNIYHPRRANGWCVTAGPLGLNANVPSEDLSDRFMLFEGTKQLPPLPFSHRLISIKGDGHYSVWNDVLFFSPTRIRHLLTHTYFVVPKTPVTKRFLQYDVKIEHPGDNTNQNLLSMVENAAQNTTRHTVGAGPIIVFTHALSPGGAERQWCYLATALKQQGEYVVLVTANILADNDAHYLPLIHRAQIPLIELPKEPSPNLFNISDLSNSMLKTILQDPGPFGGESLTRLLGVIDRLNPKAIFSQLDSTNILAATAGIIMDVPKVVLSFRNYNPSHLPYLHNNWFHDWYSVIVKSPNIMLTGNSTAANDDYAEWLNIDASKIACIPNAIDINDFPVVPDTQLHEFRIQLGLPEKCPVLLGVFRLSVEKEPILFLEVCSKLIERIPNLQVLVAGIGPLEDTMKHYINEQGITSNITLLGRRSDIASLMRIFDLLLLTSSREGMPNVLMEAQLLGLPVVATRVGGVPDCVMHGKTGYIVDVGDTTGLVSSSYSILSDPTSAKLMGSAGTDWMLSYFSKQMMATRYLSSVSDEANFAPNPTTPHGEMMTEAVEQNGNKSSPNLNYLRLV